MTDPITIECYCKTELTSLATELTCVVHQSQQLLDVSRLDQIQPDNQLTLTFHIVSKTQTACSGFG